jgi:ATP-binding cassette subfamily A (ABC1) protein 3
LTGAQLYLNQLFALLEKKMLHSIRNWPLLLIQILIPLAFIVITMEISNTVDTTKNLKPLRLSLQTYNKTSTAIEFDKRGAIKTQIYEKYLEQFSGNSVIDDIGDADMTDYYLNLSRKNQRKVNREHLYGATIAESGITAWFNNKAYHSPPISLGLVHNAILKIIPDLNCSIAVTNMPMPFLLMTRMKMTEALTNLGFQLAFNIGFAMAFVSSFFVMIYIKEQITKAKLLQLLSGVNVFLYWLSAFIWDFLIFAIIALLMTSTIGAYQKDGLKTFEQLGVIYLTFLLFGFAVLPAVYIASFLFKAPAPGFTKLSIIFMLPGIAIFTVTYCLRIKKLNLEHIADTLKTIFLAVPHFALTDAINNVNKMSLQIDVCAKVKALVGEERANLLGCKGQQNYIDESFELLKFFS